MWIRSNYTKNTDGNFSTIAAFTLSLLMVLVSAAVETSRLSSTNSKLQSITDMAVLAGAIAADKRASDRQEIVEDILAQNLAALGDKIQVQPPVIEFDDVTQTVSVQLEANVNSYLAKFLGKSELTTSVESESLFAAAAIAPISIAFALDVSGSMSNLTADGDVKIDTLKDSIPVLFESLEAGTKSKAKLAEKLRTGMSAYNTALVDQQPMDLGWDHLEDSVDALAAAGGTNSTPALQNSYDQLLEDRAYRESQGEDISDLVEYVIFMTDGDNNQPEWDIESAQICEAMKDDGIDIYSIAFAAPGKGEALLLDCASSNAGDKKKNGNKDDDKCMDSGSGGDGKALGHCDGKDKKDLEEAKSAYYFDASDADAFKEAFDEIGESIAQVYIRIL